MIVTATATVLSRTTSAVTRAAANPARVTVMSWRPNRQHKARYAGAVGQRSSPGRLHEETGDHAHRFLHVDMHAAAVGLLRRQVRSKAHEAGEDQRGTESKGRGGTLVERHPLG